MNPFPTHVPLTQSCEVKIQGAWHRVSLDDAVRHYELRLKRCPACHGRVSVNGAYSGPDFRKTLTHRRAHGGCPLKPETYSGSLSPHPQAIA